MNTLVEQLAGTNRLIIIDEAQHLTKKTLEHLRSISDETGVGICFVGNEEVYSRLKGSGKADFAQIFPGLPSAGRYYWEASNE